MSVTVFEQDDLVELLGDEPELLALADAIALTQAVRPRHRLRRRTVLLAAAAAVMVLLAVGATLAATLDGFTGWLTGTPGTPASPAAQAEFQAANAHSYARFPAGTVLNRLLVRRVGGATYTLYGFHSGDQLCLRLVAQGISGQPVLSCAPQLALEHAIAGVQVAVVDYAFGLPNRPPRPGTLAAPRASASFGFVADGVARVELTSDGGHERAVVAGNAFLAVRLHPAVGSRVRSVEATDEAGTSTPIPFAAALSLFPRRSHGGIPGPHTVQRKLGPGTIGWLVHHEPRGQSLAQAHVPRRILVGFHMAGGVAFARVLRPDPQSSIRVVASLVGKHGRNLCILTLFHGMAGGGCSVRLAPITVGLSLDEGGNQFAVLAGLARDGVASLDLFLADGERWPVRLTDNAFAIEVPRDKFPVSLVAYDGAGRIVGISPNRGF
ncbi:MAG: hypothetical protein ABSB24_03475 [Gaiellaceae bacterium]|jgi:hypothetical protein